MEKEKVIGMGNLYDMNKLILNSGRGLNSELTKQVIEEKVIPYLNSKARLMNNKYFMLLCNEKRDYTIFNIHKHKGTVVNHIKDELLECIKNRGTLYGIDQSNDKVALEIWIKEDELNCYYFFPCDECIIEIEGDEPIE